MLDISTITTGALGTNCHIISVPGRKTLIVDPGADAEVIAGTIAKGRLIISGYLITHGHIDHISALQELWSAYKAPIAMHGADLKWAFNSVNQMPPYYASPRRPAVIERTLLGGEEWIEDGFHYQVIATPGHSPGGVCYYFPDDKLLFSGDMLFQDSVGRTDLPGGNDDELQRSLQRLAALPPQTKVYPGHGPETTIAREIESNPFLK